MNILHLRQWTQGSFGQKKKKTGKSRKEYKGKVGPGRGELAAEKEKSQARRCVGERKRLGHTVTRMKAKGRGNIRQGHPALVGSKGPKGEQ